MKDKEWERKWILKDRLPLRLFCLHWSSRGGEDPSCPACRLQQWRDSPQVSKRLGRGLGRDVVAPRPQEACQHCFGPVSSPDASVALALFKAETHTIFLQSH